MELRLGELIKVLEDWMPLRWQESFDNSGLLLGDPSRKIKKSLLCTDLTDAILEEAIEIEADLIISHHPPIFSGLKSLNFSHALAARIEKAIKKDIAWYCMHTNLDNGLDGVNSYWLQYFNLQNPEILSPKEDTISRKIFGSGIIGDLPLEMKVEDFIAQLKKAPGVINCRLSRAKLDKIRKIAVCGGSGAFLLAEAQAKGADLFLTGEFKYHDFVDVPENILLVDIGHFESEMHTKEIIYTYITKNFPTFALNISKKEICPIIYC